MSLVGPHLRRPQPACSRPWGASLTRWSRLGVLLALIGTGSHRLLPAAPQPEVALVVTQRSRTNAPPGPPATTIPAGRPDQNLWTGTRLVAVTPNGPGRILTESFASACDPNVSLDGRTILFAGQQTPHAPWRVYQMNADGSAPRPVSPPDMEGWSPISVSTLFTLDSPEPWFTTVFVGRRRAPAAGDPGAAPQLFNVKLDGTELRQLTFHAGPALDPIQRWDGRLVYAAQRPQLEAGPDQMRSGLFAIHLEGADHELYAATAPDLCPQRPCATAGGWLVFTESPPAPPSEGRPPAAALGPTPHPLPPPNPTIGGQLAAVHESRPHASYRKLTDDPTVLYAFPSPWVDDAVLVARRPRAAGGSWAIGIWEMRTGRWEPLYDTPDHDELQAVVLGPRPPPDGHSTVVNTKATTGVLYGLNVYDAEEHLRTNLPAGSVQRVRLMEMVAAPPARDGHGASPGPPRWVRRLIGEAPVEADGSFNVEVPASVPVVLQTLDERGLALATCGELWVQPKETRGCVGCHEDPELIPENLYVEALRRPSHRLVLPPEQRRAVSFRHDVAPILRDHCATADCHASADSPLPMALGANQGAAPALEATYLALRRPLHPAPAGAGTDWPLGRYVDAGRARTSWLTWQVMGTNTSRPWDRLPTTPTRIVKTMPPVGKAAPLSPAELTTLVQWIDLGATLDPPSSP